MFDLRYTLHILAHSLIFHKSHILFARSDINYIVYPNLRAWSKEKMHN